MGTNDNEKGDTNEAECAYDRPTSLNKANKKSHSAKEARQVENDPGEKAMWERRYATRTLWFNGILAFTAILGTIAIYFQLRLTAESSEHAINAVNVASQANLDSVLASKRDQAASEAGQRAAQDHNKAVLERMAESNIETRRSVAVAERGLQIAADNFRTAERAWVGLEETGDVDMKKLIGDGIDIQLVFRNGGRTPAHDARICAHVGKRPDAWQPVEEDYTPVEQCRGLASIGQLVILPGGDVWVVGQHRGTPEEAERIISGLLGIYLWGTVTYKDVFNRPHRTKFCRYWQGLGSLGNKTFSFCETGNEAD